MSRMLTIKQAAEEAGLTYSTVRRWILSGEFRGYVRAGKKFLVNSDLFAEFLSGSQGNQNAR